MNNNPLGLETLDDTEGFLIPMKIVNGKQFVWYSICSAHRSHRIYCDACHLGKWREIDLKEEQ